MFKSTILSCLFVLSFGQWAVAGQWNIIFYEDFGSISKTGTRYDFLSAKPNWVSWFNGIPYKQIPFENLQNQSVGRMEISPISNHACDSAGGKVNPSLCWPIAFTQNVATAFYQAVGMEFVISKIASEDSGNHMMVMMGVNPAAGQYTRMGAGLSNLTTNGEIQGVFQITGPSISDPEELLTRFITFPLKEPIDRTGLRKYAVTFERLPYSSYLGETYFLLRGSVYQVELSESGGPRNYKLLGQHEEVFSSAGQFMSNYPDSVWGRVPSTTSGASHLLGMVFDTHVVVHLTDFYLAHWEK